MRLTFTTKLLGPSAVALTRRLTTAFTYVTEGTPSAVLSVTKLDPPPSPLPAGSISVNWMAVGVDPVDLAALSGTSKADSFRPSSSHPVVPGSEGVGVVAAVASDVEKLRPGDRVIPTRPGMGTWRESAHIAASDVLQIGSDVQTELAATLPGSPCTAYRLFHDFVNLAPGDVIYQTAGGSPVGSALARLASSYGIRVVSIVSEAARDYAPTVERLKLLGSEVTVGESYLDSAGIQSVLSSLPHPKVAFHGGNERCASLLGDIVPRECPIVTYAPGITSHSLLQDVKDFSLADWLRNADEKTIKTMVSEVVQLMKDGKISSWLQRVPFSELPTAIKEGGISNRKLVAIVQEGMQELVESRDL